MAKTDPASWSASQRLAHIEFRLFWEGRINRADLMAAFGISVPQASHDLRDYLARAPGNAVYDTRAKCYRIGPRFRPVFGQPDPAAYFAHLSAHGIAKGEPPRVDVAPLPRRHLDPGIVASFTRAMHAGLAVEARYQSMNHPEPRWLWLVPHAFGSDGFRWHVRAYSYEHRAFANFPLARMLEVRGMRRDTVDRSLDADWSTFIDVVIAANPDLHPSHRRAVERDYGMAHSRLVIAVRRALLFYLLNELRLDFDRKTAARKPAKVHPIVCLNRDELEAALHAMGHRPGAYGGASA